MHPASNYDLLSNKSSEGPQKCPSKCLGNIDNQIKPFDPRCRPWYNSKSKTIVSHITDPYVSKSSGIISTVACEIRNSSNQKIGTTGINFNMNGL